jgi:hypothetical protein
MAEQLPVLSLSRAALQEYLAWLRAQLTVTAS